MILDERLSAYERVNCHPLVNTATTGLSYADLLKFLAAVGHKPQVLKVGEAPAG